jgi:hypothetical protein
VNGSPTCSLQVASFSSFKFQFECHFLQETFSKYFI